MDVTIQWFGVLVILGSLVGLAVAGIVIVFGLVVVRRTDALAGSLLAAAAALEALALIGYVAVMAIGSFWAAGIVELVVFSQDAFAVVRPLLHAVALALVGVACLRLTRRGD